MVNEINLSGRNEYLEKAGWTYDGEKYGLPYWMCPLTKTSYPERLAVENQQARDRVTK